MHQVNMYLQILSFKVKGHTFLRCLPLPQVSLHDSLHFNVKLVRVLWTLMRFFVVSLKHVIRSSSSQDVLLKIPVLKDFGNFSMAKYCWILLPAELQVEIKRKTLQGFKGCFSEELNNIFQTNCVKHQSAATYMPIAPEQPPQVFHKKRCS